MDDLNRTVQFHDAKLYDLQGQINAITFILMSALGRLAKHDMINEKLWFDQIEAEVKVNLDMQLGSIHAVEPTEERRHYDATRRHAERCIQLLRHQKTIG